MDTDKSRRRPLSTQHRSPRLLDRLRAECRRRHYSVHTERAYADWVRRYCRFHRDPSGRPRHPETLAGPDLAAFLSHLAHPTAVGW